MDETAEARRRYADRLRESLDLRSPALHGAFARVERERYVGPPPWTVVELPSMRPRREERAAALYADVLVVIDAERRLTNGQPSLHAALLDAVDLRPGEHVVHVGTGTGYYTAILGETVGPSGRVTGVEIEPALAELARASLAHLPHVAVHAANGLELDPGEVDLFYVSAGATHIPALWLDRLRPEGRILLPLTSGLPLHTGGGALLVRRDPGGFAARFLCPIGIYPCVGGRDAELDARLAQAFRRGDWREVRSLRREAHDPEPECWLHVEGACLSRRDLP